MKFTLALAALAAATATLPSSAATITFSFQSGQDLVLFGQGDNGAGNATYTDQQGADAGGYLLLSGTIDASSNAALVGKTGSFMTSYAGGYSPQGGPNAPREISSAPGSNYFHYSYLDPSTVMTTIAGGNSFSLVSGGIFNPNGHFCFAYLNATCSGTPVPSCTQYNAGETPGAIYSGPVEVHVSYTYTSAPEPAALALLGLGAAAIAAGRRRRS